MAPNEPDARPTDLPTALSDKNDELRSLHRLASLHALHGPPGVPSRQPARATSWPASPFVSSCTMPFRVPLPERHLEVLGRGFVPGFPGCPWQDGEAEVDGLWEPEHKWFIFSESEGEAEQGGERGGRGGVWRVHMYRSWTGVKLVELRIETGLPRPARETSPSQDGVSAPDDGMKNGIDAGTREDEHGQEREEDGPRVTHITFETHRDYKLKGADAALYKSVAREVCWWVMGVFLGPETAN